MWVFTEWAGFSLLLDGVEAGEAEVVPAALGEMRLVEDVKTY